jgi:hypothetical protein
MAHKANSLTAVVYKMWDPRRLTSLWASIVCYRDYFNFLYVDDVRTSQETYI